MTKLNFHIDKRRDAKIWYDFANTFTSEKTHWINMHQKNQHPIFQSIIWKSKDDAYKILSPYLDKTYVEKNFAHIQKHTQERRETEWISLLTRLETVVWKPIPKNTIDIFLTAWYHCPYYYYPHRWFMAAPYKNSQDTTEFTPLMTTNTVLHEMLHLMLHHYYEEYILDAGLTPKEFEHLKEAQTIILDESFADILPEKDGGYNYKDYIPTREKFAEFRKHNKNFDAFVDYGIQVMKDRRNNL